jgi:hypothetical protein
LYKYNWWQHLTDWVCVLKIITQFSASITTMYRNRNSIDRQWTRTSAMNSLKISKGKSEVWNRKISLLYQILAMKTYFVEISDGILEITIYQVNNACIAVLNLSLFPFQSFVLSISIFFPINRLKNCFFQSVLTNSFYLRKF